MKYAVEMGSGAMVYIATFIKIGSGIQNLVAGVGGFTYTLTAWRPLNLLSFLHVLHIYD
jgi:hypothetical protein